MKVVAKFVDARWMQHHPIPAGGLGCVKAIQNNQRAGSNPAYLYKSMMTVEILLQWKGISRGTYVTISQI